MTPPRNVVAPLTPCLNTIHIYDIDAAYFPIVISFKDWHQRRPGVYIEKPESDHPLISYPILDTSGIPVMGVDILFPWLNDAPSPPPAGYLRGAYTINLSKSGAMPISVTIRITDNPVDPDPGGKYIKVVLANPAVGGPDKFRSGAV